MIANPCWLAESEIEKARKEQARLEYEETSRATRGAREETN